MFMYVRMLCAYAHVCVCSYVCMHMYAQMCIYMHVPACLYVCMYRNVRMSVCMCVLSGPRIIPRVHNIPLLLIL